MSFIKDIEKTPLSSKKFIAMLVSSITGKIMIGFMILYAVSPATLMWTVTCLTCIDLLYLGGQSALDIFTRLAQIKNLPQDVPTIERDKEEP